jgi:hypothetical protein
MPLQFQPYSGAKTKRQQQDETFDQLNSAAQTLPMLWLQYQNQKKQHELQAAELDLKKRQIDAQYGTGIAENVQPGQVTSAPPPTAGPEEQMFGFEATPPTFTEETPEQKIRRIGPEAYKALNPAPTTIVDPSGKVIGQANGKVTVAPGEQQYAVPIYDAEGNVTGYSQVPKGMKPFGGGKPQQDKAAENIASQVQNVDQLEKLLSDVGTGLTGKAQTLLGKATGGALAPAAKTYNDFRDSIAVSLYRAVTGDTRITDSDVKRARSITPDPYDSPEVRQNKLDNIRQALSAKQNPNGGVGLPSIGDLFQGHKVLSVKKVK